MSEVGSNLNLTTANFPLERYEPFSLLGRGGLGEVYLARDRTLGKIVAVKCLLEIDEEQIVIFHREAKIASRLHHANIVETLDFGTTEGGRPFIVFEYFDGISLEKLIEDRSGFLDEGLVRKLFLTVAKALSYIHDQKVFHRDLKPSNILLKVEDGEPTNLRVIDFGVSAIKEGIQNQTLVQGKTIVGTPVYMSPDPVRGEEFDARSEVYSIGCIMFECLTGLPPFDAPSTAEVLELHITSEPPELTEVNPELEYSPEIQAIISKCLQKDKDDRYQTMIELANALEQPYTIRGADGQMLIVAPEKKAASRLKPIATSLVVCAILGIGFAAWIMRPGQRDPLIDQKKDLRELSGKAGFNVKNSESIKLEHNDVQSSGVYLSGSDGQPRLQALANVKQRKDMVTFRKLTITASDIENLTVVRPKALQFWQCVIPEDVFKQLNSAVTIIDLTFHQCPDITVDGLASMAKLPNLQSLSLVGCDIKDAHLREIAKLKHLDKLVLDGNRDITMRGLLALSRPDRPRSVWLNAGPLTQLSEKEVAKLKEKHNIILSTKLERYEGDGGDGLVIPDALELIE